MSAFLTFCSMAYLMGLAWCLPGAMAWFIFVLRAEPLWVPISAFSINLSWQAICAGPCAFIILERHTFRAICDLMVIRKLEGVLDEQNRI